MAKISPEQGQRQRAAFLFAALSRGRSAGAVKMLRRTCPRWVRRPHAAHGLCGIWRLRHQEIGLRPAERRRELAPSGMGLVKLVAEVGKVCVPDGDRSLRLRQFGTECREVCRWPLQRSVRHAAAADAASAAPPNAFSRLAAVTPPAPFLPAARCVNAERGMVHPQTRCMPDADRSRNEHIRGSKSPSEHRFPCPKHCIPCSRPGLSSTRSRSTATASSWPSMCGPPRRPVRCVGAPPSASTADTAVVWATCLGRGGWANSICGSAGSAVQPRTARAAFSPNACPPWQRLGFGAPGDLPRRSAPLR